LRLNKLVFAVAADYRVPRLEGNMRLVMWPSSAVKFSPSHEREIHIGTQVEKAGSSFETGISLTPASRVFPVIAMAASVGGLKALSVILGGLPANFPAAIAIVMHLAPEHKSILAEILNSRTHLAVKQAHTGDVLSRGSVFVAPPNHHLSVVEDGRLKLSSSAAEKFICASVRRAAVCFGGRIYKRRAIAVVLTVATVTAHSGCRSSRSGAAQVIAQDRPTSQDFSMPETSIKTGDVDFILPLDAIAPKLIELVGADRG
jgi:two-component system chemotaxis response regulator CheB